MVSLMERIIRGLEDGAVPTPTAIQRRGPPRHREGERFLKGPIPWQWLCSASRLPGKALHVAIALWHLAGMTGSETVRLATSVLKPLGVSRYSGYRALRALEEAGLIAVTRRRGRNPIVRLLDSPDRGRVCQPMVGGTLNGSGSSSPSLLGENP
jgi:DNA-binding transcriptional ArsR family regulator